MSTLGRSHAVHRPRWRAIRRHRRSSLQAGGPTTISAGCANTTSPTYLWTPGASNAANGCPALTTTTSASFQLSSASATTGVCSYTVAVQDGTSNAGGAANVSWTATPQLSNCSSLPPRPRRRVWRSAWPSHATTCRVPRASRGPRARALPTSRRGRPTSGLSNTVTLPTAGSWTVTATVTASNGSSDGNVVGDGRAGALRSGAYNCGAAFTSTKTLTLPAWTIGAACQPPPVHGGCRPPRSQRCDCRGGHDTGCARIRGIRSIRLVRHRERPDRATCGRAVGYGVRLHERGRRQQPRDLELRGQWLALLLRGADGFRLPGVAGSEPQVFPEHQEHRTACRGRGTAISTSNSRIQDSPGLTMQGLRYAAAPFYWIRSCSRCSSVGFAGCSG